MVSYVIHGFVHTSPQSFNQNRNLAFFLGTQHLNLHTNVFIQLPIVSTCLSMTSLLRIFFLFNCTTKIEFTILIRDACCTRPSLVHAEFQIPISSSSPIIAINAPHLTLSPLILPSLSHIPTRTEQIHVAHLLPPISSTSDI